MRKEVIYAGRSPLIKLGELKPQRRFRLPDSGRTGVVVEQGIAGTTVRYDGVRRVKGNSSKTGESFEFDRHGEEKYISSGTEVELL